MSSHTEIRKDILLLSFLFVAALLIFYPVFYSEYMYTDEVVGLWYFRKGHTYHSVLPQGRYITQKLAEWLFGSISTIKELTFIRLFSFAGWLVSIPAWYYVIKKITVKENLPGILAFFSTLYLLCTPPVSIYIGWAACFELFLANTAGLLSGYLLYKGILNKEKKGSIYLVYLIGSLIVGIVSLFTYQNGFGCFLLPFLLHLLSHGRASRRLFIGVGGYLVICLVYYFLFKYSLYSNNVGPSERAVFSFKPIEKLKFLFTRAVSSSFHFTYIFNEKSIPGLLLSGILFGTWICTVFVRQKAIPYLQRIKYLLLVFLFFILIYFPSLIVKENYASNRTLLALNMAVFFLVAYEIFSVLKGSSPRRIIVVVLSVFFAVNAWYNFNKGFLQPAKKEYVQLRSYIQDNYTIDIHTVYFIQPEEDFFVRKYGITRSWDEFGVPSGFFAWVPEFFIKQVVFEQTGDRALADKIVVKHWSGQKEYDQSGMQAGEGILVIDEEKIMGN